MQRVKVLVLDESAVARQALREALSRDARLTLELVTGTPKLAERRIQEGGVDVLVLDAELRSQDPVRFIKALMALPRPIPVVAASAKGAASATAMDARAAGAVEAAQKPRPGQALDGLRLADIVYSAGLAGAKRTRPDEWKVEAKLTADVMLPPSTGRQVGARTEHVVVIGASTGGTDALRDVLTALPRHAPAIVVVQHMPAQFTRAFADRLNGLASISIKEAADGDPVRAGHALIAPGNFHTMLVRNAGSYSVEVRSGPLVARHRPSVDVLFRSAAKVAAENATGVLMTGMGDDGAEGLLELRQAGAYTVAQDKASCVVFGMPAVAIKKGAARAVVPLKGIPAEIMRWPVLGETVDLRSTTSLGYPKPR